MSSLIPSAEWSDDCVSKFSSLVRARDKFFPQSQPPVKICQSGVSPVNYSDSDHVILRSHDNDVMEARQ